MTESPELRAESADLRVLTLVTGRDLRLRACPWDGFRSRMGVANLPLTGSGRHRSSSAGGSGSLFSSDHAGAIIAVVSVADCGSATVLVALVAEDLGAGPAAVAGCIRFRRLDVARRPRPGTP